MICNFRMLLSFSPSPHKNLLGFGSLSPKKKVFLGIRIPFSPQKIVGDSDPFLQKKKVFLLGMWIPPFLQNKKKGLFVGILNWDPLLPTKTCWDVGMLNSDLVHLLLMSSTISNSPCHFIAGPPPPPFAIRVRVARHQQRPPPQNRIMSNIQFVSLPSRRAPWSPAIAARGAIRN